MSELVHLARKICAERNRAAREKVERQFLPRKARPRRPSKARIGELKWWKKPACNPAGKHKLWSGSEDATLSKSQLIYVLDRGTLVRIWCGFCFKLPDFAALSC